MKKSLISTEAFGTGLAIILSQVLPPFIGYPVAHLISWVVSCFPRGSAYQALKLNQWIASGKMLNEQELNRRVRRIFYNQGIALYDFYRALNRPDLVRRLVKMTPAFMQLVEQSKRGDQPILLLMPHLTGFNLGGLRLVQEGMRYLVLAHPNPSRGYRWQNKLRNERGMEVVPFTPANLVRARERLQQGGTVLTAVDRPLEGSNYRPQFFGYPADLPVAYIRLALKTNARVFVVGFMTLKDHTQVIDVSEEVTMERFDDLERELIVNAEKVLKLAEEFIRKDPDQWMMFFPVWPGEQANLKHHAGVKSNAHS